MTILALQSTKKEFRRRLEAAGERLYRVAYCWCHDPALAADLVQEASLKALEKSSQLRDMDDFDAWTFRILTNGYRDYLRRRKDTVDIDQMPQIESRTPEDHHGRDRTIALVQQAMARLPVEQRSVLSFIDLEGFSYAEVARIMGVPPGTVMSRIARARKALRLGITELRAEQAAAPPIYLRRIK